MMQRSRSFVVTIGQNGRGVPWTRPVPGHLSHARADPILAAGNWQKSCNDFGRGYRYENSSGHTLFVFRRPRRCSVRQRSDRNNFNYEAGMCQRRNSDHL
jgi:hypothetical protein